MHRRTSTPAKILQAVDLSFSRDDIPLFSELNFTLPPGQVLQVEGANGSGKTTLLRILCGFLVPDEGYLQWCGQPLEDDPREYQDHIAYLGHASGVKADLTALENLRIAQVLAFRPSTFSIEEALRLFGLEGYETSLCRTLSAGQKRRVTLARLLVIDASLWILDEPFTAIDRDGVAAVQSLLTRHVKFGGSIVLTSHQEVTLPDVTVTKVSL